KPMFRRFYISFNTCKEGWKVGCRPILGLDDCFLQGLTKGILLLAVERGGSNKMFPVSWVITEVGCTDFWRFVRLLKDGLGVSYGAGLTITSDQQKDLMNLDLKHWCKPFFSPHSKCDIVDNNLSETLNAWILESRCKPIISMLDDIRVVMME
ncbi:LOW QUALITY PROTEIN: hypothetical protein CFOL_v3_02045, partial [Cephalotus follicularis]